MSDRKSPLRDRPLRAPGQSIQERIDQLISDKYDTYAICTLMVVWLAFYDWIRYGFDIPIKPWVNTVAAVIVAAWSVPKILGLRKDVRRLRQARDGERIVAEVLDQLRADGAAVYHDLKAPGFNVDHVVACRQGIYVVETKTYSKRKGSKITFDGTTLLADGWRPTRDPVEQARAISRWVSETLREGTGKTYPVKPVLVFPGWYVNSIRAHGGSDVWVLNPEALPTFIENQHGKLSDEELHAAAFFLGRIARIT